MSSQYLDRVRSVRKFAHNLMADLWHPEEHCHTITAIQVRNILMSVGMIKHVETGMKRICNSCKIMIHNCN
jgi:hypothetical protein